MAHIPNDTYQDPMTFNGHLALKKRMVKDVLPNICMVVILTRTIQSYLG